MLWHVDSRQVSCVFPGSYPINNCSAIALGKIKRSANWEPQQTVRISTHLSELLLSSSSEDTRNFFPRQARISECPETEVSIPASGAAENMQWEKKSMVLEYFSCGKGLKRFERGGSPLNVWDQIWNDLFRYCWKYCKSSIPKYISLIQLVSISPAHTDTKYNLQKMCCREIFRPSGSLFQDLTLTKIFSEFYTTHKLQRSGSHFQKFNMVRYQVWYRTMLKSGIDFGKKEEKTFLAYTSISSPLRS